MKPDTPPTGEGRDDNPRWVNRAVPVVTALAGLIGALAALVSAVRG